MTPMKIIITILVSVITISGINAQFDVAEVGTLPEQVSNNAVCEGFIDGVPYLFSFGGIDSTKIYSGIHLKSYRYNIETGASERIADLPDSMGKIAAAASRVGNIIYIAGGYNVFANSTEKTTNKIHRYDIESNQYLTDGKDIPIPTDDHVQVVWRDSLIYLITGWNDSTNIPNVQIYNPSMDEWMMGTNVPNLDTYKSFGASGVIVDDKIFYFGGARSSSGFGIQNQLRIGSINPESPTDIEWSISIPDLATNGYRMAATAVDKELHWIGGSNKTYNYTGIAYDGSGVVSPNKRDIYMTTDVLEWNQHSPIEIPMDLRGIANVSKTIKYIAGGMIDNREVTNKVYKLTWKDPLSTSSIKNTNIIIGPNPFTDHITIRTEDNLISKVECFNSDGSLLFSKFPEGKFIQLSLEDLINGIYTLQIRVQGETLVRKIIKVSK